MAFLDVMPQLGPGIPNPCVWCGGEHIEINCPMRHPSEFVEKDEIEHKYEYFRVDVTPTQKDMIEKFLMLFDIEYEVKWDSE